MGRTLTVRISSELAAWLEQVATRTGASQGKIVRDQLEKAKASSSRCPFMRLAGRIRGVKDQSSRKGFSR